MTTWNPDKFTEAWTFAANMHLGQTVPGQEYSYLHHIGNVAMETAAGIASESVNDPDLAIQCALLHDVVEDTDATLEQVAERFGDGVAAGVAALTKDKTLPTKQQQMQDSLARLKQQPREVALVKLADRITNLQPPPHYWTPEKINQYREEAKLILQELGYAHETLAKRLKNKIANYPPE